MTSSPTKRITGRNKQHDGLLSFTAIDFGHRQDRRAVPHRHCERWKDAMSINHITPATTIGKPTLAEKKPELEKIVSDAVVVVGWNLQFDLRMLCAGGVDMPMVNEKYIDLMGDFTRAYNSTLRSKGKTKYKLEEAAAAVGVDYDAHTAAGDAGALIAIWKWNRDILAADNAPKAA